MAKIYATKPFPKEKLEGLQKLVGKTATLGEKEQRVTKALASVEPFKLPVNRYIDQQSDRLLVNKDAGKLVSICFGLPQVAAEIERASSQVAKLIEKEKEKEEKKKGSATQKTRNKGKPNS